ncbi:MAG: Crp/Fnr family transcriptional regulator [Gammaproteobacteria bacterium]|nr:Crp/Fnr family transcriptional regulator [Gammaproteobacteria bacterium]
MQDGRLEAAYPAFSGVADPGLDRALAAAQPVTVPGDTVLLERHEPCRAFLLLLDGLVRVYQLAPDGREVTLYRIEPGGICVMSLNSLVHERPFNAVARTEGEIDALALPAPAFRAAIDESPVFRQHVLACLSDRFCDLLSVVQDTVFNRLDMRLACLLGGLFERTGGGTLQVTHQELADELGTSREVVSRILKEFERQQCLNLSRGRIELASADGLAWFARKPGS